MKYLLKASLFLIVLNFTLITGCSNQKNNVVNGVLIHENKSKPTQPNLKITITKKFELETNDSIMERNIKGRSILEVAKDGSIFVYDNLNIKKYDKNGRFLKAFCGSGQGPGEHTSLGPLFCIKDTLFAIDSDSKKCNLFSLNGDYYYSKLLKNELNLYTLLDNQIITSCMVYTESTSNSGDVVLQKKIFDTSFKVIASENIFKKKINMQNATKIDFDLHLATIGNKYYMGIIDEDKFQIDVYNKDSKKIETIKKGYTKTKLSEIDQKMLSGFMYNQDGNRSISKAVYHKAIMGIWSDKFGRLLVLTANNKNSTEKALHFDVFKDGIFLNTVKFDLPELNKLSTKISVPKFVLFKGDYLFVFNYLNNTYSAYDYN